jgi:serine/threonine protein kinase
VIEEVVGIGGMGVVLRARDKALGRRVAIKVLNDKFQARTRTVRLFDFETRITSQLQHPNIPPVYDVGTLPDGRKYMAMKYVDGRTLNAAIRSQSQIDVPAVFEQVCQAVGYAHSRGVIHRDLKPQNIMVGAFGEVQVMDWGLAKVLGRDGRSGPDEPDLDDGLPPLVVDSPQVEGTEPGDVLGTTAYMPPEQAIGDVERIGPRTDVFGLGGILAESLTGRPPYDDPNPERVRQLAVRGWVAGCYDRLDHSGADRELIQLCKRCLAPDPSDRLPNGGAVAADVARFRAAADKREQVAELERVRAESERQAARRYGAKRLWPVAAGIGVVAAREVFDLAPGLTLGMLIALFVPIVATGLTTRPGLLGRRVAAVINGFASPLDLFPDEAPKWRRPRSPSAAFLRDVARVQEYMRSSSPCQPRVAP